MCRKGMTLLEVLVVIGIIALLAAMLLPAIANANRMTDRVACMSNLRNIVMALNGYAQDNEDRLIPSVQNWTRPEHPELSASVLYHRPTEYDLPAMIGCYARSDLLNCPDASMAYYQTPDDWTETVRSNYLFLWGAVTSTPEAGYKTLSQASPAAVAVADLTWNMCLYEGGQYRYYYGGNHLAKKGGYPRRCFMAGDQSDPVGAQYILDSRAPLLGINAAYFDGSVSWVEKGRSAWRTVGPVNQGSMCYSGVYLPARRYGDTRRKMD